MTLKEAKDQVALKYAYVNWHQMKVRYETEVWDLDKYHNEAAELYARSKWDEACTLTNRNIIHHTNLNLGDLPAKPEFKS